MSNSLGQAPVKVQEIQDKLISNLIIQFRDHPLEAGIHHPAEDILERAFQNIDSSVLMSILKGICTYSPSNVLSSSTLACLGHLTEPGTSEWRRQLIGDCLDNRSADIRHAAIQAVENWQERNLADILRSHKDLFEWINDYAQGVARDLEIPATIQPEDVASAPSPIT